MATEKIDRDKHVQIVFKIGKQHESVNMAAEFLDRFLNVFILIKGCKHILLTFSD